MTPQERLIQATQDLAAAKSKLDSAVSADNIANDSLITASAAATLASGKLAFDSAAQCFSSCWSRISWSRKSYNRWKCYISTGR
jgi:hypothetical protein